jgi:hypothetical protein
MATVRPALSSAEDETTQAVEQALGDLLDDYGRYCLGEDADPEAYVERIRGLLDDLNAGTNHDPVAVATYTAFLDRVAIEEDQAEI